MHEEYRPLMPSRPQALPPAMTLERHFPKSLDSLENIFSFLQESLKPVPTEDHIIQVLSFGAEEFFTNCIKYNRKSANDVVLRIQHSQTAVSVQIIDRDVEPFDVTQVAPRDLDASLEARRPGGLGIHLSRELLDDLSYEYSDKTSIITMTMSLRDRD